MKKILLSLTLICGFAVAHAQRVVLNEVYGNPGGTNSEFFELYNSGDPEGLDCYTLLVYFENEGGTNKGWYVLDFPSTSQIGTLPGFFVAASQNAFTTQGGPGTANLNWNDNTFRTSASGYLKKYIQNGGTNATATYIEDPSFTTSTVVNNLLDGTLNGSQFYITLLYRNGVLTNGFIGAAPSGSLTALNIPLGTLTITPAGACGANFNAFSAENLKSVEFFNPSGGNDNGYARTCDGRCGSWVKTAPQVNHTPGVSNGPSTTCTAGTLATAESVSCTEPRFVLYDVTGLGTSGATEVDDFPILVSFYADIVGLGNLSSDDVLLNAVPTQITSIAQASQQFFIPAAYRNYQIIVVYRTQRGCYDKIAFAANNCAPLPVDFKSFTATRNRTNVLLKWETATEINNYGFALERNVNGSWQEIAFVPSQATNGNSDQALVYTYNDLNNAKGISQYRIRQVDFDGKNKFSDIRSVRGDGQGGKLIVFPNPTQDGRINVVFEDANVTRDIALIDMSGRVVKQVRNISNNNITLDNLVSGMYTLRVVVPATGEQTVQKVVVNKK